MDEVAEAIRSLFWFVVLVVCLHFAFWTVIAAKETYQHNTRHDRDEARHRAECIANPPKEGPLGDIDRFLCGPMPKR